MPALLSDEESSAIQRTDARGRDPQVKPFRLLCVSLSNTQMGENRKALLLEQKEY